MNLARGIWKNAILLMNLIWSIDMQRILPFEMSLDDLLYVSVTVVKFRFKCFHSTVAGFVFL